MKENVSLLTAEQLAEKGYEVKPNKGSKVICEAPYSWCESCERCLSGSHFERIVSPDEKKYLKSEKHYRKQRRFLLRFCSCCLIVGLVCMVLLSDYFRVILVSIGIVLVLILAYICGIFGAVAGLMLPKPQKD